MNFTNQLSLTDGSVGKIILCRYGEEIILFGKMLEYPFPKEITKEEFRDIFPDKTMDKLVGYHADIPSMGVILGGSQALYVDNKLFLSGFSSKFGPVHKEVVELCLKGTVVIADNDELGWDNMLYPPVPTIEKYISKGKK